MLNDLFITRVKNAKLFLTRISEICCRGFVGLSSHTIFVLGPINESTSFRLVVFTRLSKYTHHSTKISNEIEINKHWKMYDNKTYFTTIPFFGSTRDNNLSEPP